MRDTNKFHFFIFRNSFLYKITVCFTMVITRSPGGESAGGGRSTSKPTCVVLAWTLLTAFGDRPSSCMSKFSASVNSDLGNGSFWVEIRDAEHVDRCSWKCTQVDRINCSWPLTSRDVYFFQKCLQWSYSKAVSVPTFVFGGLRGSTATRGSCYVSKDIFFGRYTLSKPHIYLLAGFNFKNPCGFLSIS